MEKLRDGRGRWHRAQGVDGWRRLAAAVLLRAVKDAQGRNVAQAAEARTWLVGEGCDVAEEIGIERKRVSAWVANLETDAEGGTR